ncbi:MAG: B12-binding domain-containing radical SAM protein [Candidatus Aegiribacteria sp.]|nr:B12-binding domain-containing radical SAM protein [Candidatus Aegiribacteria sp.]
MKLILINAYESSPFDDLFNMSALKKTGFAALKLLLSPLSNSRGKAMIPLALPTLAGLTPADWDVTILDEQVDKLNFDLEADLVGISFNTPSALRAYYVADQFRKKGIKVILGGSHASVMQEEAALHSDSVGIGEAEGYWHQVLEDASRGKLKKFYTAEEYPSLKDSPTPDFSAIDKSKYFAIHPIQTTRGCPYNCEFCTVHKLFGRHVRMRSIESIEQEINSVEENFLAFVDDNLGINKIHFKNLLEVVKNTKKKWAAQVNLDIAEDQELLESMYDSGCVLLLVGIESMSARNIEIYAAGKNDMDTMELYVRRIIDAGIGVLGMYILGFDDDSVDSIDILAEFFKKTQLTFPSISALTPFPGSDIYNNMKQENRIVSTQWSNYNFFKTVFIPKSFLAEELETSVVKIGLKAYKMRDVLLRTWKHRDMFPLFLFLSFSFKMGYQSMARKLKKGGLY